MTSTTDDRSSDVTNLDSVDLDSVDLESARHAAHDRYRSTRPLSAAADTRARAVMPGGNTRSVLHFDPFPFRVAEAAGAELVDIDGHRYVDFLGNYTAGLLGHSPDAVKAAITDALDRGWTFGATHEVEIELAELISDRFASIDQVRFTNSGTEANLMAIGTAKHVTNRPGVVVFDHAYHGGVLGFGPDPDGAHSLLNVPHDFRVGRFDDINGLEHLVGDDVACVLIEPVQGAGGCRPASVEFLKALRARCTHVGAVLIFDEVMTSRLAPGGAQERYGAVPDMTTLGKYLGGGATFGAFGGTSTLMSAFDASAGGALTQAGTFNNNIISMSAAVAALTHELTPDRIRTVNDRGDRLRAELQRVLTAANSPIYPTGVGSMICLHSPDDRLLELLFHSLLADGLYIARRGFMALSLAITDTHVDQLVSSVERWALEQSASAQS